MHQVGVGVLGPVFRGYDPNHDRVVAIKAFLLDLTPEQASELAADLGRLPSIKVAHPFVILPLGAGADGSVPYLVEEYFVAESADVALKQYGPAPMPDALRLVGQLAGALDAAAAVGVHHGALHPRDVLVAPHEVRLTGLGIVPALERVGFRPQARRPYAAPERMAGKPITGASDLFSLACIAFELLTGRRPVPSGDAVTVDSSTIQAADAAALAEVFARVLSATPDDRHPSALAFAAALKHALTGAPLQAGAENESSTTRRALRARRVAPPDAPELPIDLEPPAPPMISADTLPVPPPGAGVQPDLAAELESLPLPSFLEAYEDILPSGSERAPDAGAVNEAPAAEAPAELAAAPQPVIQAAVSDLTPPPAAVPEVAIEAKSPDRAPIEPAPLAPTPLAPAAIEPAPIDRAPIEPAPLAPAPLAPALLGPAPLESAPIEPAPLAPPPATLPLRLDGLDIVAHDDVAVAPIDPVLARPSTPDVGRSRTPTFSSFSDESPRGPMAAAIGKHLVPLLATLAVTFVLGLAVGYFAPPRGGRPASSAAAPAVLAPAASAAPSSAPSPQAAGAPGQSVAPPAAATPDPAAPPAPAPAPSGTPASATVAKAEADTAATARTARSGVLVVSSKPAGARVLIDGRAAGTTPLTLRTITPGSHRIRLELAGYRPWSSSVRVTAGRQRKIAASLQRRSGR